jgi:hypothetical protein
MHHLRKPLRHSRFLHIAIASRDLARVDGFAIRKISRAIRKEAAYAPMLSRKHFLKRDAVFF